MLEKPIRSDVPLPATPTELVTALAHFHRAEMARMSDWRARLDFTSNWAITVVAGMLSISLSTPSSHHGILLFAMVVVWLLLWIEARRYRFFDVYRARVRAFERHYFAQIFAPRPELMENWPEVLGQSLREPRFILSTWMAITRRLRRNYIWMFLILLLAWILKISSPRIQDQATAREQAHSYFEIVNNASVGPVPGWMVIFAVALFYCGLIAVSYAIKTGTGELSHGEVHI